MFEIPSSLYWNFRRSMRTGPAFREGGAGDVPAERVLQAIWFHQRILRDKLACADGRKLTVLHPGFWNRESGPDFRDALIQFEGGAPVRGDVEVDLQSSGWHGHGHDRNPAFQNVILHVVWQARDGGGLPCLGLANLLDAPIAELDEWLGGETGEILPEFLKGRCSAPLEALSAPALEELLQQAALVRLRSKAGWFAARARQTGWDQALWEGLMRALGYKHNTWTMQRLGELIPAVRDALGVSVDAVHWRALLLGMAGLLPGESKARRSDASTEAKQLWDIWWRERDRLADITLARSAWRFGGIRPANHPQRRLALAAHWLAANELPSKLGAWFLESAAKNSVITLLTCLQPAERGFWSSHWTLESAAMETPQPLLGNARATDLAINVVLPWLWSRADAGNNAELRQRAERLYTGWPAAEDNSVLKLARQRLLGGRRFPNPPSAAHQQGLIQIVRDFCDHSNAVCDQCRFPDLVRKFEGGAP